MLMSPRTLWGGLLQEVRKGEGEHTFNLRLSAKASDEDKAAFEAYIMNSMGGAYFLKKGYPKMKDPYYTWEGKVVERETLNGRKPKPVKIVQDYNIRL